MASSNFFAGSAVVTISNAKARQRIEKTIDQYINYASF